MRCIDADALKENYCKDCSFYGYVRGCEDSCTACKGVNKAPTVDVQPVVHAEWKYYKNNGIYDYYRCFHCDFKVRILEDNIKELGNYCPYCGAKNK